MGGTQPSKELSMLESLQELCRAGDIAADGGGWALQKRYEEMTALVEGNRAEFLRSGGVAATVALMLSKPGDMRLQEFCVTLLCTARPTIPQVALAWYPVVHAVTTCPQSTCIQELGTSLLLRGSLSPDLQDECLKSMAFLHAAANMLVEDLAEGGPQRAADTAPPNTSLCGEVLTALQHADGTVKHPALVELWYKTLSLTSHFVSAQDVPKILALLRKVFQSKGTSRGILLSSLVAMQRMQEAAQLHVQEAELGMVKDILSDCPDDTELVLRIFGVFRSVAFTPSAPRDSADMLRRVLEVLRATPADAADVPVAAAQLLLAHATHCPATLTNSTQVTNDVLAHLLATGHPDATAPALDVLNMLVTNDMLSQAFHPSSIGSLASMPLSTYHMALPYITAWAEVVRNDPDAAATHTLNEATQRVLVRDLLKYVADENQRWRAEPQELLRSRIETGVQAVEAWAALVPSSTHLLILCLADTLVETSACFDRPVVAAVAALIPRLHPCHAKQVHILFGAVYGREAGYWFPDRATLSTMKGFAGAVPRGVSDKWGVPDVFQKFVYET